MLVLISTSLGLKTSCGAVYCREGGGGRGVRTSRFPYPLIPVPILLLLTTASLRSFDWKILCNVAQFPRISPASRPLFPPPPCPLPLYCAVQILTFESAISQRLQTQKSLLGQRAVDRRDSGGNGIFTAEILRLPFLSFVTVNSQSKIHYVFTTPVSPGDHPLAKKSEESTISDETVETLRNE